MTKINLDSTSHFLKAVNTHFLSHITQHGSRMCWCLSLHRHSHHECDLTICSLSFSSHCSFRVFLLCLLLVEHVFVRLLLPCGLHRDNIPLAQHHMWILALFPKLPSNTRREGEEAAQSVLEFRALALPLTSWCCANLSVKVCSCTVRQLIVQSCLNGRMGKDVLVHLKPTHNLRVAVGVSMIFNFSITGFRNLAKISDERGQPATLSAFTRRSKGITENLCPFSP